MARGDAYYWRLCATALCFAAFGLACLGLGVLVFPLMRLLPGGPQAHRTRARRTLQTALRAFAHFMRFTGVLSYEFQGIAHLGRPGQIIVANHPSLIDVVFLLGFAPSCSCVVKQALWTNPLTRWTVLAVGYVSNSPTDLMIEDASRALQEGQSVIIFPEGTRTMPGQPLHFHRGAAAIAIRAAKVVTPVYIRCEPTTLAKNIPWYQIPERRAHLSLRTGEDVDPEPFRNAAPAPLAARAFNEHLRNLFTHELARTDDRVAEHP